MKLLLELRELDIGLCDIESFTSPYKLRKAARAVLFNNDNKIALLYVSKHKYHKLPGGGVEEGEDLRIALARESLEEVGSSLEVMDGVGIIVEYRNKMNELQISYCYTAKTVGEFGDPSFTDKEKGDGFQLLWVTLDEAIELLSHDNPDNYVGKFIQKRDLFFLSKVHKTNL